MIMFAVAALVSVFCMATKLKLFYDKYRARNRSGNGGGGNDVLSIAARRRAVKDRVDGIVLDQHRMYPPLKSERAACPLRVLVPLRVWRVHSYCDLVLLIGEVCCHPRPPARPS